MNLKSRLTVSPSPAIDIRCSHKCLANNAPKRWVPVFVVFFALFWEAMRVLPALADIVVDSVSVHHT